MVALHPRPFALAVTGAAIFAMATVASSWALGRVTDDVIVPRFEEGDVAGGTVASGLGLVVGIGLVKAAGIILRRVSATIAGARIQATLRKRVVRRYQEVPYSFHRRTPTGELLSHAGNDVDAAVEVLAPLPYSTGVVVIVVLSIGWMLATDPWLALVAFTVFPALVLLNIRYQRAIGAPAERVQARLGDVSSVAHESFDGAVVVKVLGAEALEAERFAAAAGDLRQAKVSVATVRAGFEAVLDALPALGTLVLLPIGAWRVDHGAITTGTIVSFVALFQLLVFPLRLIGYVLGELPKSVVGHDRIERVLAEPADPRHAVVGAAADATAGARGARLEVHDLAFAHEPGIDVLDGVSFTVEPGRTVALVGPTGCGKSTLLLLVAGLLEPEQGSIRIDGRDLSSIDVAALRAEVATAFQEAFLFADTVAENVLLGWPAEDLQPALALAGAERFVAELDGGPDAVVGERGATLSGGQRQRLALARALVRRPRLLLLDDATSAVDPTKEHEIRDALAEVMRDRTTIVIAHRPATIALADRVVLLDGGRVAATGTHGELLASNERYRQVLASASTRAAADAAEPVEAEEVGG